MKYLIVLSLSLLISGCTQNNGQIGDLFGLWILAEKYPTNHTEINNQDSRLFIAFQGEIVCLKNIVAPHSYKECFGKYKLSCDSITFEFLEGDLSIINDFNFNKKETFGINTSKKKLTLSKEQCYWNFSKY
ncbi:MAG: lipocalin-like domain-containing protein [Bacteroidales bacterium]